MNEFTNDSYPELSVSMCKKWIILLNPNSRVVYFLDHTDGSVLQNLQYDFSGFNEDRINNYNLQLFEDKMLFLMVGIQVKFVEITGDPLVI